MKFYNFLVFIKDLKINKPNYKHTYIIIKTLVINSTYVYSTIP